MNDPIPVDENHSGWKHLSQKEKRIFKNLKARDEAYGDLAPDQESELDHLVDIIRNGRPIDEKHPGFIDNLNPEE